MQCNLGLVPLHYSCTLRCTNKFVDRTDDQVNFFVLIRFGYCVITVFLERKAGKAPVFLSVGSSLCMSVCVCVCVCACMCAYVLACVRAGVCVRESESKREQLCALAYVIASVCVHTRLILCVCA